MRPTVLLTRNEISMFKYVGIFDAPGFFFSSIKLFRDANISAKRLNPVRNSNAFVNNMFRNLVSQIHLTAVFFYGDHKSLSSTTQA